ncbi:protein KNATM-like [Lotus japonicus]|uniref:protein KNATM-like n=1 Tax=Lotus japonicus TaxID=34305 RepID=UPI0025876B55|nr:protein KNATM-like [Lotus japonicus]
MEGSEIGENGRRKEVEGSDIVEKENEEDLKKIIASHPLYEVLIESHMNCLKVGSEEAGELDITTDAWKNLINSNSKATCSLELDTSDLDHFMEAYCMTLKTLKEATEEPAKEAKSFINTTYIQLKELSEANNPELLISSKDLDDGFSP